MRVIPNMATETTRTEDSEPVKGMGVTFNCGSDRYPYTVIEVLTSKTLVIQEDKVVQGADGKPTLVRDEQGEVKTITFRRNGRWYEQGSKMGRGLNYTVGTRQREMAQEF